MELMEDRDKSPRIQIWSVTQRHLLLQLYRGCLGNRTTRFPRYNPLGACFLWEDPSGDMTTISISSYGVVLVFREFSQIITSWVLMQQSQHCSTSKSFCEGAVFSKILPNPLCIYVAGLIPFTSHAEMFFFSLYLLGPEHSMYFGCSNTRSVDLP